MSTFLKKRVVSQIARASGGAGPHANSGASRSTRPRAERPDTGGHARDDVFDPLVQTLLDVVASSMDGVAPVLTEANRMRNACGFLNGALCAKRRRPSWTAFCVCVHYVLRRTRMGAFQSPFSSRAALPA